MTPIIIPMILAPMVFTGRRLMFSCATKEFRQICAKVITAFLETADIPIMNKINTALETTTGLRQVTLRFLNISWINSTRLRKSGTRQRITKTYLREKRKERWGVRSTRTSQHRSTPRTCFEHKRGWARPKHRSTGIPRN